MENCAVVASFAKKKLYIKKMYNSFNTLPESNTTERNRLLDYNPTENPFQRSLERRHCGNGMLLRG